MLSYILRRILLMLPTLVGITFVVFMLLALSPGGIGAGLLAAGGGSMQSSNSIAIQRAKLEDRYGLNEPAVVQYWRWLGRVSPIKFGQRDLVSPNGDLISKPRPVPEPAAWAWFAPALPAVAAPDPAKVAELFPAGDDAARAAAFTKVAHDYTDARAAFTSTDALLRDALKRYVEGVLPRGEWDRYISGVRVKPERLARLTPERGAPEFKEAAKFGDEAIKQWHRAAEARGLLVAGMKTRPYPEAGIGLIPGVVSLALPDLGTAFSVQQPVSTLIKRYLPVTLLINLIAFPIIYLVAIPSGMLAALRRGTWVDLGLGGVFVALYSIPVVLAGVLTLGFLATPEYLAFFPAGGLHDKQADTFTYLPSAGGRGFLLDTLWHVALPVVCIVYTGFAVLSKQTRAAMLENLNADYVRTAKAKGVANRDVVFAHVLRNSLLPLITMFVTIFPAMLTGSVVVERIFSVPGMGYLLLDAIYQRDRELILGNATIIAVVNLSALLLADILYAFADPRITYK